MQLESLRYYLEVIRAESITKAANNIFISQQGLSKAIQSLEKEFHVALLKRSENGKTIPTEAGQEFAVIAQNILSSMEDLKQNMSNFTEEGHPLVQDGETTILITTYLANTLNFLFDRHEFQDKFSGKVIILEKSYGKICKALRETPKDTIAIANVCPSVIRDRMIPEGFVFDPIINMNMLLKCSPDFIVGKKKSVTLEEVRTLPLAVYNEPMLTTVLNGLFGDTELNILMHTTNRREIENAVLRGDVATFTDTFVQSALSRRPEGAFRDDNYVCIPIQGDTQFMVGFLSARGAQRSASCLRYEAFCKKYLELKYSHYMKRHPVSFSPTIESADLYND